MKQAKYFRLSLLLVPMLLLPGCCTSQKEQKQETLQLETPSTLADTKTVDDGSPVLMKIDGRSAITLNTINKDFDRLLEENPHFKPMLANMPDAKLNYFQGMANQKIMNRYVSVNKIDQSPEYQRELEKTIEQVKDMLNMNYFDIHHQANVSSAEVKKFYDENKDKIPNLMQSQGGVKTEGVSFAQEEDARAFLAKAKETQESFDKLAAEAGFANAYQDFKMVNLQSAQVEPSLKAYITKLSRFPALEVFKAGDKWWVIKAYSKAEPTYVPFESVKPMLEEHLQKQKQAEVREKALDKYKKEYNVEINDAPLRSASSELEVEEHAQGPDVQSAMRAA